MLNIKVVVRMIGWTIAVAVVLVALYFLLFGSNAIAVIAVKGGQCKVVKGSFNPAFLSEAERLLKGANGKVKVEPEHNYMVLKFDGDFSQQQQQALTNIFPHDNYRSACSAFKVFR